MGSSSVPTSMKARQLWGGGLIAVGVLLVGASLFWSNRTTDLAPWSQDQARKYQAASLKLHSLSHEIAHAAGTEKAAQVQAELAKAQADYAVVRSELDSAIARGSFIASLMRYGGVTLAAIGAVAFYTSRESGG